MRAHGATTEEARAKIHCMDRRGVILELHDDASEGQKLYADPDALWEGVNTRSLLEAVRKIKPTVLIGCSTQPVACNEPVIT